jgi:hypothetical protein
MSDALILAENRQGPSGTVSLSVYKSYFNGVRGGATVVVAVILCYILENCAQVSSGELQFSRVK